jgi:hypothetical protein
MLLPCFLLNPWHANSGGNRPFNPDYFKFETQLDFGSGLLPLSESDTYPPPRLLGIALSANAGDA